MKSKILSIAFTSLMLLLWSSNSNAQNSKNTTVKSESSAIQVIQFHSEHRCMTCNLIEKLARETLKENFPTISFRLINVDDSKNEKIAEEFEATGTALFIYNPTSKKKKDMTDFAFMNAKSDGKKFKEGLKKEITNFK